MAHVRAIPFCFWVRGVAERNRDRVGQERDDTLRLVCRESDAEPAIERQVYLPAVERRGAQERDRAPVHDHVMVLEGTDVAHPRVESFERVYVGHAIGFYRPGRTASRCKGTCEARRRLRRAGQVRQTTVTTTPKV